VAKRIGLRRPCLEFPGPDRAGHTVCTSVDRPPIQAYLDFAPGRRALKCESSETYAEQHLPTYAEPACFPAQMHKRPRESPTATNPGGFRADPWVTGGTAGPEPNHCRNRHRRDRHRTRLSRTAPLAGATVPIHGPTAWCRRRIATTAANGTFSGSSRPGCMTTRRGHPTRTRAGTAAALTATGGVSTSTKTIASAYQTASTLKETSPGTPRSARAASTLCKERNAEAPSVPVARLGRSVPTVFPRADGGDRHCTLAASARRGRRGGDLAEARRSPGADPVGGIHRDAGRRLPVPASASTATGARRPSPRSTRRRCRARDHANELYGKPTSSMAPNGLDIVPSPRPRALAERTPAPPSTSSADDNGVLHDPRLARRRS